MPESIGQGSRRRFAPPNGISGFNKPSAQMDATGKKPACGTP